LRLEQSRPTLADGARGAAARRALSEREGSCPCLRDLLRFPSLGSSLGRSYSAARRTANCGKRRGRPGSGTTPRPRSLGAPSGNLPGRAGQAPRNINHPTARRDRKGHSTSPCSALRGRSSEIYGLHQAGGTSSFARRLGGGGPRNASRRPPPLLQQSRSGTLDIPESMTGQFRREQMSPLSRAAHTLARHKSELGVPATGCRQFAKRPPAMHAFPLQSRHRSFFPPGAARKRAGLRADRIDAAGRVSDRLPMECRPRPSVRRSSLRSPTGAPRCE
jgi:hypothetical protein